MRAKFVYESYKNILKAKSEKEIGKFLDKLNPNKLLIKASELGSINYVKKALDNGADVHYNHDLALKSASRYGHLEVVKLLLDNGADVHVNHDVVLLLASRNNHPDVVKLLKKYM